MINEYQDIFQLRGLEHAEAFNIYPDSVKEEVNAILDLASPAPNEILLDIASASGFLSRYINVPDVRLLAVDPSPQMYLLCKKVVKESFLAPLNQLPFPDEYVDVAICLAGLHHQHKIIDVFQEVFRVLVSAGRFAIAEVNAGSKPDIFLNDFVNNHSSLGHKGNFVTSQYLDDLQKAGFVVVSDNQVSYHWRFSSTEDLAHCLKLMFGIDKASPEKIIYAVSDILGIDYFENGSIGMRWSLRHILCVKGNSKNQKLAFEKIG